MPRPSLVLFRMAGHDDPFEAVFERAGWDVRSISVLKFTHANEEKLRRSLSALSPYEGLILTSPRAGDLLASILSADTLLQEKWKTLPIVCIGQRTATKLIQCGLAPHITPEAGSEAVAQGVINFDIKGRWLFVCGNLRREELPFMLDQAGVPFEELQVYHTHPGIDINLGDISPPDWAAFFSPSGVQAVQAVWPAHWKNTKKAAIGATTAKAIEHAGWRVTSVAEKPEAESLLEAVTQKETR